MFSWFPQRNSRVEEDGRNGSGLEESSPILILPSSSSTHHSTVTNGNDYGTVEQGAGNHLDNEPSNGSLELYTPLHRGDSLDQNPSWKLSSVDAQRCKVQGCIVVSILIVALIAMVALDAPAVDTVSPRNQSPYPPVDPVEKLSQQRRVPFSTLDPVKDLGLKQISHGEATSPPKMIHKIENRTGPLPTCAWYQNLIMNRGEPGSLQRVYTNPLVLDVSGPIPGLRVHPNHVGSSVTVMQLSYEDQNGITVGISRASSTKTQSGEDKLSNAYSILSTTPLGITLQWDSFPMTASIVRGMPFTTMHYPIDLIATNGLFPTMKSQVELSGDPIVDGRHVMRCNDRGTSLPVHVESKLRVVYKQSDFTYLYFFSQPVMVRCVTIVLPEPKEAPEGPPGALGPKKTVEIQVVDLVDAHSINEQLTIRAVLLNNCTAGLNPLYCQGGANDKSLIDEYETALERAAPFYPGPETSFQYNVDNDKDMANLHFDWDVRNMINETDKSRSLPEARNVSNGRSEFLMFALPHHLDRMGKEYKTRFELCKPSLIGRICLVHGATWSLEEPLPPLSFRAELAPRPSAFKRLAEALKKDINFRVSSYYRRGAGDTYFSGKVLAKQARVLLIADELQELCSMNSVEYSAVCENITLPTQEDMKASLDALRAASEIWINGTAETPFVYESAWGGIISCGCYFNGKTKKCDNKFPECPTVTDPGLNFGNGFYNDHHFHYGYHLAAAAAVSHFDPAWGRAHFEQFLLLVRDIANPSKDDIYFPVFRQKDWYQGHSWASGVPLPPYLNGKNQESSSEAIAGYEAVALFGKVMVTAWEEVGDEKRTISAQEVRDVGRLLTATEIRSTDRYYHVRHTDESKAIYPSVFRESVVGVMWNMMAQFQTWFGSAPYLAYGIQLLPLTPVSESRDDVKWLREMYKPYADSCNENPNCEADGWSVMQLAILASVGHVEFAMDRAQALSPKAFTSAGGNGHSRSNTLWYISTRPEVNPTLELPLSDSIVQATPTRPEVVSSFELTNCGCNSTCTEDVLNRDAMGFTCGQRMEWLISSALKTETDACITVGGKEFPNQCGPCNPNRCHEADFVAHFEEATSEEAQKCPPCSPAQCQSGLNNCPLYPHVYVCSSGPSMGGCSDHAWDIGPGQCHECCELTTCKSKVPDKSYIEPDLKNGTAPQIYESSCPLCSAKICHSSLNRCDIDHNPFLCTDGPSVGGCDANPWKIGAEVCLECCKLYAQCELH